MPFFRCDASGVFDDELLCITVFTDWIFFPPKLLVEILMRPTLTMQKKKPKSQCS